MKYKLYKKKHKKRYLQNKNYIKKAIFATNI